MNKFKQIVLMLGLLGLLVMIPASKAKAVNTGIQISPVTFNFEIKPGETQTGNILITNRNDETMDYVMELEIFENSSETGVPSFTAVKPTEGVSTFIDWVKFPNGDKGSIEVGKSKEVNFTISVPADAEPGGHYGAIFAKQTKPLIEGANQVGVAARVGALTLISVPGKTTQGAQILEFKAPKFVWKGTINIKMRVQNTGSVHFDSNAIAKLQNIIGEPTSLDMGTHTLLPKNIRVFEATWQKKYPFGYYKITPTATDGDGNIVSGAAVTIWAIPLVIVIPIIIFLILLILIVGYFKRHFKYQANPASEPKN